MDPAYLRSLGPLVNISVLEASAVRVRVKTRTWWYGYDGHGVDPKLDINHASEKTFTIYRDGRIYVQDVDVLREHSELGGSFVNDSWPAGRATFMHPVNARSGAGFTLATNYSMDAANLYPRGGGVARWLLQWGQNTNADPINGQVCSEHCTAMNFLQVPEDLTCEIGTIDVYTHIHLQDMQNEVASALSGYRWGLSPSFLDFEAWSNFTKRFLYQLGTAGSDLMPDVVTMETANAIADAYLHPANLSVSAGGDVWEAGFDKAEGCYTLSSGGGGEALIFTITTSFALRLPVFCVQQWAAAVAVGVELNGAALTADAVAYAAEIGSGPTGLLLVHLLQQLDVGAHELIFTPA